MSSVISSVVPFVVPFSEVHSLDMAGLTHLPRRLNPLFATYNSDVARGWESKSVEAQQAEATNKSDKPHARLSPEAAARSRDRESLRLSRQRVLQQLESAQNPRHRKMLEESLSALDEKLKALG